MSRDCDTGVAAHTTPPSSLVEPVLLLRNPPATPEALALYRECYPAPCEHDCWHSSCWAIRDLESRLLDE